MITVLGATGNVGRELVAQLRGSPVRIVTRRPDAPADGVERVVGDLSDPATIARAMAGADRLFWVLVVGGEPPIDDRAIVAEARRAGVRHIVLLSSIGATYPIPLGRHHREREEWIEESGLDWTFLRPGYFMSNALQWARTVVSEGRVVAPILDGRTAPIAPRDIAEVAALALRISGHEGKIYSLTGDEDLSVREQVAVLGRAIGRTIECVEIPIEAAADAMRRAGRPEWMVDSLVTMWKQAGSGECAARTDAFAALTGHAPQRFADWCAAHRSAFGA